MTGQEGNAERNTTRRGRVVDLDHNADAGDWIKGRGRALRRSDVVPEFNPQSYPPLQEFWEVGLKVEAWADGRMFRIEAKRDTRGGQVDG